MDSIRPNFRLYFKSEYRDDWLNNDHDFWTTTDEQARKEADSLIMNRNNEDDRRIKDGEKSGWNWNICKPLKLVRLSYDIHTGVQEIRISLQGDVASRASNVDLLN
ncbi:hypothetical protein KW805_03500 [Candidatus Pacearchaeota archaeon]|nr:hypothetical protein [Candidatus Pacearchaeota archaeon]